MRRLVTVVVLVLFGLGVAVNPAGAHTTLTQVGAYTPKHERGTDLIEGTGRAAAIAMHKVGMPVPKGHPKVKYDDKHQIQVRVRVWTDMPRPIPDYWRTIGYGVSTPDNKKEAGTTKPNLYAVALAPCLDGTHTYETKVDYMIWGVGGLLTKRRFSYEKDITC